MNKDNSILETAALLWWDNGISEFGQYTLRSFYFPTHEGALSTSQICIIYQSEHPTKPLLESPTDNKGEEPMLKEDWIKGFKDLNADFIKMAILANDLKKYNLKLLSDVKVLKELESNFYMAICRAYNAGKQCLSNQHEDARNKGKEAFNDRFISSHDYFVEEFPEFKTNVP